MNGGAKIVMTRIAHAAGKARSLLARPFVGLGDARPRRAALEQKFGRKLEAYCRADNLSPIRVEDWKLRGWRQN